MYKAKNLKYTSDNSQSEFREFKTVEEAISTAIYEYNHNCRTVELSGHTLEIDTKSGKATGVKKSKDFKSEN